MLDRPAEPDRIFRLELTTLDCNVVLATLQQSELPHRAVMAVLRKVSEQIAAQGVVAEPTTTEPAGG